MADNHPSLQKRMCKLSEAVLLGSANDLPHLAAVHTELQEIGLMAQKAQASNCATAASAAADLLEKVILQEIEAAPALDVILRTVMALHEVLVNGRDVHEVKMPPELKTHPAEHAPEAPRTRSGDEKISPAVDGQILAEFLGRQPGVLDEMESLVLGLERSADGKCPAELRRLIHTMKGEAALIGFKAVESACHRVEDALDKRPLAALIDPFLELRDWLGRFFLWHGGNSPAPSSPEPILKKFEGENPRTPPAQDQAPTGKEAAKKSDPVSANSAPSNLDPTLLGEFINESFEHLEAAETGMLTLESDAANHDALGAVFRAFHTIKGVAGFLGLESIGRLAHEAENLFDGARKGTLVLQGGMIDVSFDAIDMLKRMIHELRESGGDGPAAAKPMLDDLLSRLRIAASGEPLPASAIPAQPGRRLGEILVDQGVITPQAMVSALEIQQDDPRAPRMGQVLVEEKLAPARVVAMALRAQKGEGTPAAGTVQVRETVKVDADRLDALVEMIGELVIAESMVSQAQELRSCASGKLLAHLKELDKITRELQAMGTGLRMIPLRATFQKMARLVRDVARKAGKQVDFVMTGEETELDKMVVDKIGDPLIHMIRNAVDHGLEGNSADRTAAGKAPVGRVELRAFHRGGNIFIEIADDGRGLNRDAILAKARERGLIAADAQLSDREVFNLIFHAGLSTAKQVTDVSGRGVGMDVVRKNVEALRGHIEIQSAPGRGSTFSICLPLTLAIIDGMVLRVAGERYIVPTLSIHTTLRPEPSMVTTVFGRGQLLRLQDNLIPLFRLDRLFAAGCETLSEEIPIIVIVENDGERIGLIADQLLGQQQIVIKPLGEQMHDTLGISGGAIMPDGQVSLIVDIGGVAKMANQVAALRPMANHSGEQIQGKAG